ncbi:MAG TPA: DUF99 family protein [Thermoplasmata archaeon]|nr:DUF99 family protein [Thermoplasmata archaeon]
MNRALAKPHLRVIGVDDGAFRRTDRTAPLAAVVLSSPQDVEAVLLGEVTVDGTDATATIIRMLKGSSHLVGARALLVDGVAVGGFNVLDLAALSRRLGLPVVSVTRRPPDFPRIRAALAKYFPRDFRRRWSRIRAFPLFPIPTLGRPILASAVGCTRREATALVQRLAVRGYWPEPLRLAHLIAHAAGTSGVAKRGTGKTIIAPADLASAGL